MSVWPGNETCEIINVYKCKLSQALLYLADMFINKLKTKLIVFFDRMVSNTKRIHNGFWRNFPVRAKQMPSKVYLSVRKLDSFLVIACQPGGAGSELQLLIRVITPERGMHWENPSKDWSTRNRKKKIECFAKFIKRIRRSLQKCTTSVVCVSYEFDLQQKQTR